MSEVRDVGEAGLGDANRSDRNFWIGFTVGWAVYFTMVTAYEISLTPDRVGWVLSVLTLNFSPFILGTWVLALNRRRLLRPDRTFWRACALHAATGFTFSLAMTGARLVMIELGLLASIEEIVLQPGIRGFILSMMTSFVLYVVFLGGLMWAESTRALRESQATIAREAVLRAEAEAKAVRAQFNPHFVFNTLHSLMLLVRADPAAAERAIEDVATLIRYASIIQRRDIDAVPMAKEVEVVRRYLSLEQLRLGDRLSVSWTVDPEARWMAVPAFALQTLVENAVKHGIEPVESGGTVSVSVRFVDEDLVVEVRDDGAGADPATVATPGHGLELLQRRLASRYGDAAAVRWETRPGEGFVVTLTLPDEAAPAAADLGVIEEREPTDEQGAVFVIGARL